MGKPETIDERKVITRAMRSLLDKGVSPQSIAMLHLDCLTDALTNPDRCGHVLVDLESGVYRCGRNAGHDGEHGRRK